MVGIVQKTKRKKTSLDIAILLFWSVTHDPGNWHVAKHLEVPNYIQEEYLSIGGSLSEMLRFINWGLKIGFKERKLLDISRQLDCW